MSGRIHVFLYEGAREKLAEMTGQLGLPQDDNGYGTLLKEGATLLYQVWKDGKLTPEQLAHIKHVNQPTLRLERKVRVFLNEGTIKRLDDMEITLEIYHFDSVKSHLMQFGFDLLYGGWKAGTLPPEKLAELRGPEGVFKPKVVYHS